MMDPKTAERQRLTNIANAIDRFEKEIDHKLSGNHERRWPIFVSQAEDQPPEVVMGLIPKYVKGGWTCWYKPDGFLFLAPKSVKVDDTRHPHDRMGQRYE